TANGVWHAPLPGEGATVTGQLLAFDVEHRPEATHGRIWLDLTSPIAGLDLYAGGRASLSLGYRSGASGAAEFGNVIDLYVERVERTVDRGRRVAVLHVSGPWE